MSIVDRMFEFLNESPNDITFKNKELEWTDDDSFPFVYDKKTDKLYFHKDLNGDTHGELYKREEEADPDVNLRSESGKRNGLVGRIWKYSKIISFWKLPTSDELKKIISHFKEFGIKMDSSWVIDIFNKNNDNIFVPVEDYIKDKSIADKLPKASGEDLKKLRDLHLLSPLEKKKALDAMGVKSKNIVLPKNMTVAQYHNMTRQESFVSKIIKFLNEEPVTPKNKVPGGRGDKLKPKDVDPKELEMGTKHEMEHTKDREIAQEIALDHLSEDPKYYTNMKKKGIK